MVNKYVEGTVETVRYQIGVEAPGYTFSPEDWTAGYELVTKGSEATGFYMPCTIVVADHKTYAEFDLSGSEPVGKYKVFFLLTNTQGETEVPRIEGDGILAIQAAIA
jgi:hypothetical protein